MMRTCVVYPLPQHMRSQLLSLPHIRPFVPREYLVFLQYLGEFSIYTSSFFLGGPSSNFSCKTVSETSLAALVL